MPLQPIGAVGAFDATNRIQNEQGSALPLPGASTDSQTSFGKILSDAIGDVNALQTNANAMVEKFAKGGQMDVHEVMIAMEQAKTAMSMTLQVRNKLVEAYQEVMRTAV